MKRLPRPSRFMHWPLLVERSRAGARRRTRLFAVVGFAALALGLLWAVGLGVPVAAFVVSWAVVTALLELAAAVQAGGRRRLLASGVSLARYPVTAAAAAWPPLSRLLTAAAAAGMAAARSRRLSMRAAASAVAAVAACARKRRRELLDVA